LSRIVETETPDGAKEKTIYKGNEITFIDEALKTRKSQADAFGRLREIYEDSILDTDQNPQTRLNYETSYDYDAIGNLITINQGEQIRTFTYDSLSRLRSATNPESGTVHFTYDANNNLFTKTDARGVIVTNTYDAINRPLTKEYSDSTPDITYTYDESIPNSRGNLTQVETGVSISRNTQFSQLGRILSSQQIIDGQTYEFSYSYNLSGDITSKTYPISGRVINFEYNNDGDLSRVSGKPRQNATPLTYASAFTYTADGSIKSLPYM